MSSEEEKSNKAKIIVLSIILAVVVVFIIVFAVIQIVKIKKAEEPNVPAEEQVVEEEKKEEEKPAVPDNNPTYTNSYNDSISQHILSEDGYAYTGTYSFDSCGKIIYNYKSDSNPDGFTAEEVKQFWKENNCSTANEFRIKLINEKNGVLENSTITINQPIDDNTGTNIPYGVFENKLTSRTMTGKVYGDTNLAVMLNDDESQDYQFLSLKYKEMSNAISVSELSEKEQETVGNYIYVFDNVYKDGKLLYTITYIYSKVTQSQPVSQEV